MHEISDMSDGRCNVCRWAFKYLQVDGGMFVKDFKANALSSARGSCYLLWLVDILIKFIMIAVEIHTHTGVKVGVALAVFHS